MDAVKINELLFIVCMMEGQGSGYNFLILEVIAPFVLPNIDANSPREVPL
jgi:hypothetical protein